MTIASEIARLEAHVVRGEGTVRQPHEHPLGLSAEETRRLEAAERRRGRGAQESTPEVRLLTLLDGAWLRWALATLPEGGHAVHAHAVAVICGLTTAEVWQRAEAAGGVEVSDGAGRQLRSDWARALLRQLGTRVAGI